MRDDIEINELLKMHLCTLRKASKDNNRDEYMTESKIKVVNFDKMPKEYCKRMKVKNLPCSNDALYVSKDNVWYFIEFKNGSVDTAEIYRKFYDSILILLEMGVIPDLQFAREHIIFILVYNSKKYPTNKISLGREQTYKFIRKRAEEEQNFLTYISLKIIFARKHIHILKKHFMKSLLNKWNRRS